MIDVESKIYSPLAVALRNNFPGVNVSGEYVRSPSVFPFVSITESDNYMSTAHLDSSDTEKYAVVMYEVNVYSNKTTGRKSEVRRILRFIDAYMYGHNFVRTVSAVIPNLDNASIYRMVARYRATVSDTTIYR